MKGFLTSVVIACTASVLAQPLTLDELLFRANLAVIEYEQLFSNVVVEEQSVQRIVRADGTVERERRLRSDFVLILLPGADAWLGFRDVFEVDGESVRDRERRMEQLFLDDSRSAVEQAAKIANESARYNIGDVRRTVNLPTVALGFLHPLHQHRFRFEHVGTEIIHDRHAWVVRYSEHAQPTIMRAPTGNVFGYGRFWLDMESGRAVRSELTLGDGASSIRTSIRVGYRPDEALGIWVPETMDEVYDFPGSSRADRIEATATYSNFRQFGVSTDQTIAPPR